MDEIEDWSEWALLFLWIVSVIFLDNAFNLFLDAYVGDFFLGVEAHVETFLHGPEFGSIFDEETDLSKFLCLVLTESISSEDGIHFVNRHHDWE